MAKQDGIYKCDICGNVVSMVLAKEPNVVCCGQEMTLQEPKTEEEGNEKHVPIMEIDGNRVKVKVGSVPHPMEENHFIVFIRLMKDGKLIAGKRLYPGQKPELEFIVEDPTGLTAYEYCNVHGLWKS